MFASVADAVVAIIIVIIIVMIPLYLYSKLIRLISAESECTFFRAIYVQASKVARLLLANVRVCIDALVCWTKIESGSCKGL